MNNIENFSNDEMYSFKTAQESSYQSIPLLAPENDNLMFGQAKRFVSAIDGTFVYRLEIYCNLLVLDGNIYDKAPCWSPANASNRYSKSVRENGKPQDPLHRKRRQTRLGIQQDILQEAMRCRPD